MPAEIHVDDEPILRATVKDQDGAVVDVSGATTLEIKLKKPSGTTNTRSAVLTTDGTDGRIQYQVAAGEFDEIGEWQRQARVVVATRPYSSDIERFPVERNL